MSAAARHPGRTTLAFGIAATIGVSLPVFLLGTLVVAITADVPVPVWGLGVMVAAFWTAGAAASSRAGDLDRRWGSRPLTVVSLVLAAVALVGMGFVTPSWEWFVVWAVVAGLGNGVQHPATNSLITARVTVRKRGLAFGLKQSAVPATTLLAGLAIPFVAFTIGWRWGFGVAAIYVIVTIVLFLLLAPRTETADRRAAAVSMPRDLRNTFLVLAVMAFCAAALVTASISYVVTAAVQRGYTATEAGLLLSVVSVVGIAARPITGVIADRNGAIALPLSAALVGVGGIGAAIVAASSGPLFLLGVFLVAGLSGTWAGLFHYFTSRTAGVLTSSATGIAQTGSFIGCAGGPALFALLSAVDPFVAPWVLMAVLGVAGSVIGLVLAGRGIQPYSPPEVRAA